MPTPRLTREQCIETVTAVEAAMREGYVLNGQPSAITRVAEIQGVPRRKIEHHIKAARARYGVGASLDIKGTIKTSETSDRLSKMEASRPIETPTLPDFPDDDIPVSEIVDLMCRRFERRSEHKASKKWFRIEMPSDQPFAVLWWGDPHIDSNGANWPLIREHAQLAQHPGVYSANIGDTLDNWPSGSRLMALYAHSDTSVETAHKLARWFIRESGIRWLVWLFGNHDSWIGHTSSDWVRELGGSKIAFEDWGAQFVICCPGGAEFRIWAAHDFPGHSMYNTLHGGQKAAMMKAEADLYVCGHKHCWAIHREENAERGFTYSIIRARGYKHIDSYADKLGYASQRHGSSVLTVFDPENSRHYNFEHPEDGILFLDALRARRVAA